MTSLSCTGPTESLMCLLNWLHTWRFIFFWNYWLSPDAICLRTGYSNLVLLKPNNRIIEWFRLKGIFKGHLFQSLCHDQGQLHLDPIAQGPVQPDHECLQGWDLLAKTVPVFYHSSHKKIWSLNRLSFFLKPVPVILSLWDIIKDLPPSCL